MWNADTLANCVRALRAEVGHSLSTVQGQNIVDTLKYLLQRTQYDIWLEYQFPPLKSRADVGLVSGQYLYAWPDPLQFELVREVWTAQTGAAQWTPLDYKIPENLIMAGGDNSQAGTPPQFWDVAGPTQFRVWPTPSADSQWVRFLYQAPLAPFLADTDMSTLDSTVIVLFAAAGVLARTKAEDAALKLKQAQALAAAMMGRMVTSKRKTSTLASGPPVRGTGQQTPYLDYIPQTN